MSPVMIPVVIPADNAALCLPQARERVPRQTHTTTGTLVDDDGSADHCGEVAQDHLDSRIGVVRQRIAGPAAACAMSRLGSSAPGGGAAPRHVRSS